MRRAVEAGDCREQPIGHALSLAKTTSRRQPGLAHIPHKYLNGTSHLIHDGDAAYGRDFDERTRAAGVIRIQTPRRAPHANAIAERVVRSFRFECLDHMIVINARHLLAVLTEFVEYYNHDRPIAALPSAARSRGDLRRMGRSHREPCWVGCTTSISVQLELDRLRPCHEVDGVARRARRSGRDRRRCSGSKTRSPTGP